MGINYDVKLVCILDECVMGNFRYIFLVIDLILD